MRFNKATLVKVALFTATCVAATVVLALRLTNYQLFAHYKQYQAVFTDATGVHEGDAVKVAGVDVGRVINASISHGKAVVRFELSKDVPLTTTTTAALRWRNVLGLRYLYLYPHRGGKPLAQGGTIPVSRTTDAADIGRFLNDVGPVLQAIDPKEANAFVRAVDQALNGDEATVGQLIDNGARLVTQLAGINHEISHTIVTSDEILHAYATQNHAIAGILDNLDRTSGTLQGARNDINGVLRNFSDVQGRLHYLLRSERGNIDATLGNLDTVLTTLARNKGRLERTLCTTPMGVSGYWQTTSWGEWFNVRLTTVNFSGPSSSPILTQSELPQERPNHHSAPALFHCPGAHAYFDKTGRGGGPPAPAVPGPGGGLDQIVQMLTGGGHA